MSETLTGADRVAPHLQPGESLLAAVLVSRADARSSAGMSRAELSPFRWRRLRTADARPGIDGPPQSRAAGLDEHLRTVTDPRLLALTDRRLLVLSRPVRRRPGSPLCWECPRVDLVAATEQEPGRLRLAFADGSTAGLLSPAAHLATFVAAAGPA